AWLPGTARCSRCVGPLRPSPSWRSFRRASPTAPACWSCRYRPGAAMRFRAARCFMLCWSPQWAYPRRASPNPGGIGGIAEQSAAIPEGSAELRSNRREAERRPSEASPAGASPKRSVAKWASQKRSCADDLRADTRLRARARRRGSSSRLPATFRDTGGRAWKGACLSVRAFVGADAVGCARCRARGDGGLGETRRAWARGIAPPLDSLSRESGSRACLPDGGRSQRSRRDELAHRQPAFHARQLLSARRSASEDPHRGGCLLLRPARGSLTARMAWHRSRSRPDRA